MSLPGSGLRAFAVLLCRPSTIERLIDPIISDLRVEYNATAGSPWRRRGVLLRAYVGFWKALAIHMVFSAGGRSEPVEQVVFRRVIGLSFLGFALVTLLLVLPPLLDGFPVINGKGRQVLLALTLIPQALPLSIPIGVCIGIMGAIRAQPVTRRDFLITLAMGFIATCLVVAVMEWGLPSGNQKFREMMIAELTDGRVVHIEPGLNELGLSGLARRTDLAAVRQYHVMWALGFAAIALAMFSLALAARLRRTASRAFLTFLTLFAYYAVLWVSHSSLRDGAPVLVAWAPNAVFLVAGVVLSWWRSAVSTASPRIGVSRSERP
jgi:lipopolysaccharide export LptBFGC system permease protein LptF